MYTKQSIKNYVIGMILPIIIFICLLPLNLKSQDDKACIWSQATIDYISDPLGGYSYNNTNHRLVLSWDISWQRTLAPLYLYDLNSSKLVEVSLPLLPNLNDYRKIGENHPGSNAKSFSSLFYKVHSTAFVAIYNLESSNEYKYYPIVFNNSNYSVVNYFRNINNQYFLLQKDNNINFEIYQLVGDTIQYFKDIDEGALGTIAIDYSNNLIISADVLENYRDISIRKFTFTGDKVLDDTLHNLTDYDINYRVLSPNGKYLYVGNNSPNHSSKVTIYDISTNTKVFEADNIYSFDNHYSVSDDEFFTYFTKDVDLKRVNLLTKDVKEIKYEDVKFIKYALLGSLPYLSALYLGDGKYLLLTGDKIFCYSENSKQEYLLYRYNNSEYIQFSPDSKFIIGNNDQTNRAQRTANGRLALLDSISGNYNAVTFLGYDNKIIKSRNQIKLLKDSVFLFDYFPDSENPFVVDRLLFNNKFSHINYMSTNPSGDKILITNTLSECNVISYPELNNIYSQFYLQIDKPRFFNDTTLVGIINYKNGFQTTWQYLFINIMSGKIDTLENENFMTDSRDTTIINPFTIQDTMIVSAASLRDSNSLYYIFNKNVFIKKTGDDYFKSFVADFQFIPHSNYALVLAKNCRLFIMNVLNTDDYHEISYPGSDELSEMMWQSSRRITYLKISPDGRYAYLRTNFTENCFDLTQYLSVNEKGKTIKKGNIIDNQLVDNNLVISPEFPLALDQIDIFALDGRKVKTITGDLNFIGKSQVYVGDLNQGSYFVRLSGKQGVFRAYFMKE